MPPRASAGTIRSLQRLTDIPAIASQRNAVAIARHQHQTPPSQNTTKTPQFAPSRFFSSTPSANHNPHPNKSSVDPTEVSHFNALASSWWDPQGPSRLLHLMNPLRHDFISRCRSTSSTFSTPPPQKQRYLDIGCGGGIFAESAARLPSTLSVTAIDPTPEVLKIAEAHKRRDPTLMSPGKLAYLNTSIEGLPVPETPSEAYDVVSLFEVIEHVNSPGEFLEHVMKQVKPGAWIVGSTIARTWTSWLITNVVAEDILGIVPKGTHEWNKYIDEIELRNWFAKKEGWGKMQSMGVVYVPGLGWKEASGGEAWGNYFFGIQKLE